VQNNEVVFLFVMFSPRAVDILMLLLPAGVMEWQVLSEIRHHDCMMIRFIYLFRLA
jgi:hypothetical protein